MEKKLPKVFANKITKKLENNEKVYYSKDKPQEEEVVKEEKSDKVKKAKTTIKPNIISEKIKAIFSATDFVYKSDVKITYDGKTVTKRIIGHNNKSIITYDNELIPIDKITDIEKL